MDKQSVCKPVVQKICVKIEHSFDQMENTLEDIGYTGDMQLIYYDQAFTHITELINDMVSEIQMKKQVMVDTIKNLLKQTSQLYAELHLDATPKTYEQIPLCKVEQMLQADLQELERAKKERVMILKELLARDHEICRKLGCEALSVAPNVLPTEKELEHLKLYLQKQELEKARLENHFADVRRSIIKMMSDLGISPAPASFEELICSSPEEFVLTKENLQKLREFKDELNMQVVDARECVEGLKEELAALWRYLDEPDDLHESFFQRHLGYNAATVEALNAEIKRCKEQRKKNIAGHIEKLRHEIRELWDKCKYSDVERYAFVDFYTGAYDENLLRSHEEQIKRLNEFYKENRTIFELLDQHEDLVLRSMEMVKQTSNPDRYYNRGGRLLKEETERKELRVNFDSVQKALNVLIAEYEAKHERTFTIEGRPWEKVVADTQADINREWEKVREEAKSAFKKSPLNVSKRTPGMSHLSVHRGPTLGLSKRKLGFTPSPNSSKRRNKNGDKNQLTVAASMNQLATAGSSKSQSAIPASINQPAAAGSSKSQSATPASKNQPTVPASKIRRSGRIPRSAHKSRRSPNGERKNKDSLSTSITDTTYNQFLGHMTDREELQSSMLPEQTLRSANKINIKKTPVRTPIKPLRKHLSATTVTTPVTRGSARKAPHSPRVVNTPKMTTAPNFNYLF